MKIYILVLLGLCLTASLAADECKNHKAYQKAKALIKDIASTHSTDASAKAEKFSTYFESKTPSTSSTADELGVCNQYQGHQSCCDAKIAKFIENSALLKVKPLQNQNNIIKKLLNALVKQMNKGSCTALQGVTKPASADDLIKNTNLTLLQKLITNSKQCKINFAKVMVQFARGAACTMCAGVDQISSLFDANDNIIISTASAQQFETDSAAALQCFKDIVSWTAIGSYDSLQSIVNQITAAYVDSTCQTAISTKIQTIFTNNGGIASGACKATTVFSKQSSCESAQQGDSTIDTQAGARFLQSMGFENIRVLQTTDSTTSSTGVNIIVSSTSDSNIDADGNVTVDVNDPNSAGKLAINSFLLASLSLLLFSL